MTIAQFFLLYAACGLIWFFCGLYTVVTHFRCAFAGQRVAIVSTSPELAERIATSVRSLAEKLRKHPDLLTPLQLWGRIVRYSTPGLLAQGLLWFIPVINMLFRKRYTAYVEEIK